MVRYGEDLLFPLFLAPPDISMLEIVRKKSAPNLAEARL